MIFAIKSLEFKPCRINTNMVVYRSKFVLLNNEVYYYVGKDKHNNKSYFGSGSLVPWFERHAIYKQKIIIDTADTFEEMGEKEEYWINRLGCVESKNYLNIKPGGSGGCDYNYNKWKLSMIAATPKRVESYKKTVRNRSRHEQLLVSKNISRGVKRAFSKIPEEVHRERHQRSVETYKNKTMEEKEEISRKISIASKRVASERKRDPERDLEYRIKVSEGVSKYRSERETDQQKEERKRKYRESMYSKNGMLAYVDQVISMIKESKPSLEIYHYLKSQGIKTHHICVKGFLDFIQKYYIM